MLKVWYQKEQHIHDSNSGLNAWFACWIILVFVGIFCSAPVWLFWHTRPQQDRLLIIAAVQVIAVLGQWLDCQGVWTIHLLYFAWIHMEFSNFYSFSQNASKPPLTSCKRQTEITGPPVPSFFGGWRFLSWQEHWTMCLVSPRPPRSWWVGG